MKAGGDFIINYVVHSVILYAAPVWAELQIKAAFRELQLLWNLQKQISIRVIAGYCRTVALISALLLTRISLIELQAELLTPKKKKKMLENGTMDQGILNKYHEDLSREMVETWKCKIEKPILPESEERYFASYIRMDE